MANFNLPAIPVTPLGPLSGVYRGTQYNYGVADLDRQFRDSDLLNQRQQNLYQNELLDNPKLAAGREEAIAKSGYETSLINSGAKLDLFNTELTGKKGANQAQDLLNQKNEIILASDALSRAAAMPPMALIGQWDELGKQAKALKIKWPDGGATPENMQIVKQLAEASRMTVERMNALELENIKFGHTMAANSFNKDASYKQAIDVANIGARASRDAANINASALKQQAIDRDTYQKALLEVAKDGTLSYDTALALGEATLKTEGITIDKLRTDAKMQVAKEQRERDKPLSPAEQSVRVDTLATEAWTAMAVSRGLNLAKGQLPAKDLKKLPPHTAELLQKTGKVATGPGASEGAAPPNAGANATPKVSTVNPQKAEALIARFMAENADKGVTREIAIRELSKVADMSSVSATPSSTVSEPPKRTTVGDLNKQIVNSAVSSVTPDNPVGNLNKRILDTLTGQ